MGTMKNTMCECGCGQEVNPGRRFINGHQNRGENNPMFGKTHAIEATEKITKSLIGRSVSVDTREKIRGSLMGHQHSVETRKKMSDSHTGIPLSEEHRIRMGDANRNPSQEIRDNKSKAALGRIVSYDTRKKIGIANSGENHGMYGVRGGGDLVNHHYIYDENDLSLNTVKMKRSDHASLHQLFRKVGYVVPHIHNNATISI